jgi:hypothetical protein
MGCLGLTVAAAAAVAVAVAVSVAAVAAVGAVAVVVGVLVELKNKRGVDYLSRGRDRGIRSSGAKARKG